MWKHFVNWKSVNHKFKVTYSSKAVTVQLTHSSVSMFSAEFQLLHPYTYYTYTNTFYIFKRNYGSLLLITSLPDQLDKC